MGSPQAMTSGGDPHPQIRPKLRQDEEVPELPDSSSTSPVGWGHNLLSIINGK